MFQIILTLGAVGVALANAPVVSVVATLYAAGKIVESLEEEKGGKK